MSDDLADAHAATSPADGRAPNREGSRQREEARSAVHSPRPDLTILEARVYRGPNYWSYDKAIHLLVDLGSLEDFPSNTIPGFTDRLLELLGGLVDGGLGLLEVLLGRAILELIQASLVTLEAFASGGDLGLGVLDLGVL